MNQKETLNKAIKELKKNQIEEPARKAKIVLAFVLNQTVEQLTIYDLQTVDIQKQFIYEAKIKEIIQGKPLQYIVQKQEFMGLSFYVDENVLIPQPDTEIMVEKVIELAKQKQENLSILDLCTGSGAIAVSLAFYLPNVSIVATDISEQALEIAKKNAKQNQVENKIQWISSNMFESIPLQTFDIIVSNPPYIETEVIPKLATEVRQEPMLALDGGKDGLNFYRCIAENAKKYLKSNGSMYLEIGYDQKNSVIGLFETSYHSIECIKDYGGNDRVIKMDY